LEHFPTFKRYTWKEWLTLFIGCGVIVSAVYSILMFASQAGLNRTSFFGEWFNLAILIIWSCGPPAWFYVEYYVLWPDADIETKEKLKVGRELAKPFWAAVIATLLFLVPK